MLKAKGNGIIGGYLQGGNRLCRSLLLGMMGLDAYLSCLFTGLL